MNQPNNQSIRVGNISNSENIAIHISPPDDRERPKPFMALSPPDDYVQRPHEYNQLINYLLIGEERTVAITATLKGAGGFGKTTLAQAICHDQGIRDAFPDGILWATIGEEGNNVTLGLRKLYHAVTGREAQFVDQHDATTQLRDALQDQRYLIVIDDVWNAAHLQPFLQGGEQCARLVTTRIASVAPKQADVVTVDAMQMNEATALLGAGLTIDNSNNEPATLSQLAQRLGEWPLLLKLVNRRLYEDVEYGGLSLIDAVEGVNEELHDFGLTSFDADNAEERDQAVAASIGVSLRRLQKDALYGRMTVDEVARFMELVIFPEDSIIPVSTLTLLWGQTGGLTDAAAKKLCRRLADLSLVSRYDMHIQKVLLHDITQRYLVYQTSREKYNQLQHILLKGYSKKCNGVWWELIDDNYIFQYLLWHLGEAGEQAQLEELLLTYRWLDVKLQATNIVSLIEDFDLRWDDENRHSQLGLLKHALQMSVSVLARDKNQLASQLHGRLLESGKSWVTFTNEIKNQRRVRWLQSKTQNLSPSGGNLLYTLSGHANGVSNLLLTRDRRLITSCGTTNSIHNNRDSTIKVWNIDNGTLIYSLEGHIDGVSNLLLINSHYLISSCNNIKSNYDYSIKVWNIDNGRLIYSFEGHTDQISNLLLTNDNRLISSSKDNTIKIWDISSGTLLHSLEGHTTAVENLMLISDQKLITSSNNDIDPSIKVWDIANGNLLHNLEGHIIGADKLVNVSNHYLISSCSTTK
ncbi:MAG: NB-ARC domain-containing protein, partial [Chloroflexota bacterium]